MKVSNAGIAKLKKLGIKTTADLDAYIKANPSTDGSLNSRYGMLKTLLGERDADAILRELEVASWF